MRLNTGPALFMFHLHNGALTETYHVNSVASMYRICSMMAHVPIAGIVVAYPCGWRVNLTACEALSNMHTVTVPEVHIYPVKDDLLDGWVLETGRSTCTL